MSNSNKFVWTYPHLFRGDTVFCVVTQELDGQCGALSHFWCQQKAHGTGELQVGFRYVAGAQKSVEEIYGQREHLILAVLFFAYLDEKQNI